MVSRGRKKKGSRPLTEEDADYLQWKARIPLIYDWFTNHNLSWPSLSCRWGQQLEQKTYKNVQRLYLSERTDGTYPNTLVIANCEVVKPRIATAEHISMFDEESQSPHVNRIKTIIHPGEVNKIRELPQNSKIVATHTDSPEVLVWDVDAQPDCGDCLGSADCHPNLILTGHQSNAEYALAMCNSEPLVLSGGKDNLVVLWSIHDHVSALANTMPTASPGMSNGGQTCNHSMKAINYKIAHSPTVAPRNIFHGHRDTVEDVQFCPFSPQEFCSVGDDSCLILWDARAGNNPVIKVEKAHDGDINCVDWNPYDVNLLLTGSADSSAKMFDRRNLTSRGVGSSVHTFQHHKAAVGVGSSVHTFQHHKAAVLCVQWSPDKSSVFGSAGEDSFLNVWDHEKVCASDEYSNPPGLFFQHAGHRDKVVDFHWSATEPWTIASVSDDCARVNGGGTLQVWRISDFIYRPKEEVLAELEMYHHQICY
ncbi:WD-40 repeat-containing protein MSI4-like isoform X1 [Canna indica]|uniref:WD-40 repeat-containing protein MSI4-like isoform X1 n=1 Tax=Canna indica TaxID=4628 RepID=A0AAQ3QI46_9LILI|nr:WD-40 repeat-containing protein MSI4-like isoform X1 [Canna indica]